MILPPCHRFILMVLVFGLINACSGPNVGPVETTFDKASVRVSKNVVAKFKLDFRTAYDRIEEAAVNDARPNYNKARLDELTAKLSSGAKLPLIVYFHGCAGMLMASMEHLLWLAKLEDFVVIAPDSFARARPHYCFGDFSVNTSIYRLVAQMRKAEIMHALNRAVELPWVDKDNIFLIGHSQGGGLVAGYSGPVKIRGRIILNGGCNTGLGGDGMQDDEALLTFDTGRDPWFFNNYTSHCRAYVSSHPNGQSIYEADSRTHNLVIKYWPLVKKFLKENRH
jgi:dienelactone hydrolase